MALIKCPQCGQDVSDCAAVCIHCGCPVLQAKIHCPKCGSNNITSDKRGWNLRRGFLGSNQTVNKCLDCGNKWRPI